ncbi:MAG: 1-deoxy-D-xylulose-5-phosphate reductoisomerase [Clostridia bacterium]|nr:1-deoxy-D-xylulose-5-phosphate reductoisomerase [Clostridia bacterium]
MGKIISVLGATGSVGRQALDVARERGFSVDFLCANRDVSAVEEYAREFHPSAVAMADENAARDLRVRLADTSVKVLSGEGGIEEGILSSKSEVAVNSIIGEAGLIPSLTVIKSGKRLALANKESLVIAGDIVMAAAREVGCEIIPVDSEHSAIFQSLKSGKNKEIKRILLTASGGPFYGMTREELCGVTLEQTLAHPTWKMGKKITVDSATLMNKGFEIIEAVHLFDTPADKVEVVVHRESILHSAVEYIDNSVIAELSVPDMRMCVQYAVDYPDRCPSVSRQLDLFEVGTLTFKKPDTEAFPFLNLAREAITLGGAVPAVMNAADEVAVGAFLSGRLSFTDIFRVVTNTVHGMRDAASIRTLDGIIAADREARRKAEELLNK